MRLEVHWTVVPAAIGGVVGFDRQLQRHCAIVGMDLPEQNFFARIYTPTNVSNTRNLKKWLILNFLLLLVKLLKRIMQYKKFLDYLENNC